MIPSQTPDVLAFKANYPAQFLSPHLCTHCTFCLVHPSTNSISLSTGITSILPSPWRLPFSGNPPALGLDYLLQTLHPQNQSVLSYGTAIPYLGRESFGFLTSETSRYSMPGSLAGKSGGQGSSFATDSPCELEHLPCALLASVFSLFSLDL